MARPPTEIRTAIVRALGAGPCTLVDIVQRANVGYDAARYTLQNMVRGGVVQICGQEKRAHSKQWLAIYELAADAEPEPVVAEPGSPVQADFEPLGGALRAWCVPRQYQTEECDCG